MFDPNVAAQPKPGTRLQLGEYYPADGSSAHLVTGYLSSDSIMVVYVDPENASADPKRNPGKASLPPKPGGASAGSYTWNFGNSPERSREK